MPSHRKAHSKKRKEEDQRNKRMPRQTDKTADKRGGAVAMPARVADDLGPLLVDPDSAHPVNASLRARALAELQRQRGNTYVQGVIRAKSVVNPPDIQRANGTGSESLTWTAWLWSGDGVEYNKLRTQLEAAKYRFITHVRAEGGGWEKKFPTSNTPASQVGWSIGTPEGKWKWATTADVVAVCRKMLSPKLLKDFATKFPDAGDLIRRNPEAMRLVIEADNGGAKFGGYAEDGPAKNAWAYTVGSTVYVPKARTDKVLAMGDFLFELNNAIRRPRFAKVEKGVAEGTVTAKQYAYKNVELEVEGMLRLGEIWFKTKKTIGKGAAWNKYDSDFYLSEYEAFKAGKKTKDDLVKDVLKRVYSSGKDKGKTVEQFYVDQHKSLSGGK